MLLGINDSVDQSNQYRERSNISYGWGKYRPKCLQFLNTPRWFIAAVVVYSLCQGIGTIGLIFLVLPSIERRFSLSSKELGIIAASSDISALLLVVFVSFYGGYGNKIRWMGGGAVLVGVGLILFSLPHFIVGKYKPIDMRASGLCLLTNSTINQGPPQCKVPSGGEWYYMMIFIVAQLIIGAGVSPFHSLLPAYLDENVAPKSMPVYLGIWFGFTFIGPGVGYFIGGKLLSIYVDIDQPPGLNLTPRHPSWIGAWWLGFLIFGLLVLLCAVIFLGFPREMPGAKERRLEHIRQGHIIDAVDGGETPKLRDILRELKNLLTNWTFTFNSLALTVALLYGASVGVFFSKIFRLKFGVDPVTSGYILALFNIIGVALGNVCGSLTVRMFSLKETCKKAALACFIFLSLSSFFPLMFLLPGCMNSNLAGIAEPYHNGALSGQIPTIPSVNDSPLKSQCNINCGCSLKRFSPVCGTDSVTYASACYAGCRVRLPNKTYANCSCIPHGARTNRHTGGSANPGYCDRKCKNIIVFAVLSCLVLIMQFSTVVPAKTVMLRCVPDNKRAFATGINYVILKTLGLLPGPIIFGHLVDLSCRLWQDSCGKKGRCFDYDIENLSRTICFYGIGITCVACFCFFLSWYLCKPPIETGVETSAKLIEKPEASPSSAEETCL